MFGIACFMCHSVTPFNPIPQSICTAFYVLKWIENTIKCYYPYVPFISLSKKKGAEKIKKKILQNDWSILILNTKKRELQYTWVSVYACERNLRATKCFCVSHFLAGAQLRKYIACKSTNNWIETVTAHLNEILITT